MLIALRRGGFRVESVKTAQDALYELSCNKFDFLITDIKMPETNGITLANIVHELHPEIKVILMSSFDFSEICTRNSAVEDFPFIQKPVDFNELRTLLISSL